jgi:Tfp pilus assembly protein PilF
MSKPPRLPFFLIAAGLAVVVFGGCSAQARKARAIAQGDRYFAAGQYDAAEIDYQNALRIDQGSAQALRRLGVIY